MKKTEDLGFSKLLLGFDVSEIALQVMHTYLLSFKDQYVECIYFKYIHPIHWFEVTVCKFSYDKSLCFRHFMTSMSPVPQYLVQISVKKKNTQII